MMPSGFNPEPFGNLTGGKYWGCKLCGVPLQRRTPDAKVRHLASKTHKAVVAELDRQRLSHLTGSHQELLLWQQPFLTLCFVYS